jgi:tetratricopeptide (TPR) repeat protein
MADPDDLDATLQALAKNAAHLAMLSVEMGCYEEALRWARTLLATTDRMPGVRMRVPTLSFIAAVYEDLHQSEQAERCLREVLALDPRCQEAWFNLANALASQKRFAEALEAARQAVALRPANGAYRVRLGSLLTDLVSPAAGALEIRMGAQLLDDAGLPTRFDRMWRWIAARLMDDAEAVARVEPLLFPAETIH